MRNGSDESSIESRSRQVVASFPNRGISPELKHLPELLQRLVRLQRFAEPCGAHVSNLVVVKAAKGRETGAMSRRSNPATAGGGVFPESRHISRTKALT